MLIDNLLDMYMKFIKGDNVIDWKMKESNGRIKKSIITTFLIALIVSGDDDNQ